jgi:hypothetical protein
MGVVDPTTTEESAGNYEYVGVNVTPSDVNVAGFGTGADAALLPVVNTTLNRSASGQCHASTES